jgi:nucleoside-diphosphate-sugar epimerase
MKKTLIVGRNSFIGKSFFHSIKDVDIIDYSDIIFTDFTKYDTVLNCIITPEMRVEPWKERNNIDLSIGRTAITNDCHYIMMSTRKVYGSNSELKVYDENSNTNPSDYYSENKLIVENKLQDLKGSLTIVRASNVYGFEYGRNSFMGFCMNQLKQTNRIVYNVNPRAQRDFISIKHLCEVLKLVVDIKPQGVYNVSSNHGTEIGEVAKSLIEGYGQGEFIADWQGNQNQDQFILNNNKLCKQLKIEIPIMQRKYIKRLGEKL